MVFPGLASWIERRAVRSPDRVAVRAAATTITYEELARHARAFGRRLREEGLASGDRVAYHGPNDPAALITLFGARTIGAVWVPLLPGRSAEEVAHILRDSGATVVVGADGAIGAGANVRTLAFDDLGARGSSGDAADEHVGHDDLAVLGYTSGTTGPPKGVMLTEANILWNAIQMVPALGLSGSDVTLGAAPFTRIGGIGVTVLPTLFAGGTIAIPADTYGSTVLETIERERVTHVFANPDLLDAMACAPGWPGTDLSSIRTAVVGGGLVPPSLLRTYLDRGVPLRHGYGLTEAAPVVSVLDADEAAEHPTSVGKPLPFVEVRAVRPDGSACEPGEVGAWQIRGPNVFAGYWGLPSPFDPEGWFATGDVGTIDGEGYLTFADRASSVIALEGAFVYPSQVEADLFGIPGLSDVGVVDVGARLIAGVVPEASADVTTEVLDRMRASVGEAVAVEARTVEAIPRNAAGKVRRDALRDLLRG